MQSRKARLEAIERQFAKVTTPSDEYWTLDQWLERLCWAFCHNELHIDAPHHVAISAGASLNDYSLLRELEFWVNEEFERRPDAILCPLTAAQVTMGLRVLEAGLIDAYLRVWPGITSMDDGCYYGFGERLDLHGLVYDLNQALKVTDAQAPGVFERSLEGMAAMLQWQKEEMEL